MKYLGFSAGKLIEAFVILPGLDVTWMTLSTGRFLDFRFTWLFWYITFGQIHNKLKEDGYGN